MPSNDHLFATLQLIRQLQPPARPAFSIQLCIMGALPARELTVFRYAAYIEELREFLASYGLRYGSPYDLSAVTRRLQEPAPFAGDLALILRSIAQREGPALSRAEMLEMLARAIGGPVMERPPKSCRLHLTQLFGFVTEVRRRPLSSTSDVRGQLIPFPSSTFAESGGH
jgi:hypothetical protein